jgi:hypothetical protein
VLRLLWRRQDSGNKARHITLAQLLIISISGLVFSSSAFAAAWTCSAGSGADIIGTEYIANQCPGASGNDNTTYTYYANDLQCSGGKAVSTSAYTQTASPALLTMIAGTSYRILRNTKGTHFILVSKYYTGTLDGKNMTSYPAGSTPYYNVITTVAFPPPSLPDSDGDGYIIW